MWRCAVFVLFCWTLVGCQTSLTKEWTKEELSQLPVEEKYRLAREFVDEGIRLAKRASEEVNEYRQLELYREAIRSFRQALYLFGELETSLPPARAKGMTAWSEKVQQFIEDCLRDRPELLREEDTPS